VPFHAATATHSAAVLVLTHTPRPAESLATAQTSTTAHLAAWFATTGGLLALAALVTAGYAFSCWIWPFKPCRHCHGTGKRRAPFDPNAIRIHGRCNGTGLRLRTGRRVYEYLRTEQRRTHH